MTTHGFYILETRCDSIQIGERHRKDLGNLEALAASIAAEGLLQPIGITEENVLVFGERRLRAVQDVLRRESISARVVHVSSITAGEYAENEIRKDFTPSERVAIGKALEDQAPERRGSPIPQYIAELKGLETRELAAKKAGFGNRTTYEQAKRVVDDGAPELVEAMDSGDVSISAAAVIAAEPRERQEQIVQLPGKLRRRMVRELREAAKLPTPGEARRLVPEAPQTDAPPAAAREAKQADTAPASPAPIRTTRSQRIDRLARLTLSFIEATKHLAHLVGWLGETAGEFTEAELLVSNASNAIAAVTAAIERKALAADPLNASRLGIQENKA